MDLTNERIALLEKRVAQLESKLEKLTKAYPKSRRELSNDERLQKINEFLSNANANNT